jgi:zinc protease
VTGSAIQKTVLPNGLTLVTEERHTAPVVSFWVGYRVGSRNEPTGLTGAAHWIEHMLFKPTDQFPGTERDRLVSREGGATNAFTWFDGTAYFATLPSTQADLMYRVEADRMANSRIEPEITETERTVILAERNQYENIPDWRLSEQVISTAFQVHPYGHETIGLQADLERMTRDDLYGFYRAHYTPNNAVAVAVGSFDTHQVQDRVEELFGAIPPGAEPPMVRAVEPESTGERRVQLGGPGGTSYLEVAYHGIASDDPDFVPAALMTTILGGPINLVMGSEGESRSSRLYRTLVETELAADVECSMEATIDPYLLQISAVVMQGRSHDEVEAAIDNVMNDIATRPVPDEELARARKQAIASFVYGNERITNRAMMMTIAEMVYGLDLLDGYKDRVNSVTVEDIQRVATRLLRTQNRVVGRYIPDTA